jgi:hypothetical protein
MPIKETVTGIASLRQCHGCGRDLSEVAGNPRKWCSEKCRKMSYYETTCACGRKTWGRERCGDCARGDRLAQRRIAQKQRRIAIVLLRQEGLLNYEIAERLGVSTLAVASQVSQMRQEGWSVPASAYNRHLWMDAHAMVA